MASLISWLLLGVNALAVSLVSLSRQNLPNEFWTPDRSWLIVAAIAASGLVPFLQFGGTERGERARRKALEREQRINAILAVALVQAANRAGADWEQTGIQAFRVRKRWLHRSDQERIGKVRLSAVPSSGVRWTQGKGVIGRCWELQRHHCVNLEGHFASYLTYDRQRWDALSHEARYGLTFEEFQKIKDKYGLVAAVPVVDRKDRYIGCVTADMPPGGQLSAVNRDELLGALAASAVLVGLILSE